MDSGGKKMIRVKGTTDSSITEETEYQEEVYNFNVIRITGDLVLDGTEKNIEGLNLSEDKKIYSVGNDSDVGISAAGEVGYAKNTVVLKVEGDLEIKSGITVEAYSGSYGGPKRIYSVCLKKKKKFRYN